MAARAAAPSGSFVLNARTDTHFAGAGGDVFADTVERATRYIEAGADCIFVPGVAEPDTIRRIAAAIPGPAQHRGRAGQYDRHAHALLTRRQAGQPWRQPRPGRTEHAGTRGTRLHDSGTLGFLDGAISYADVQRLFGHAMPSGDQSPKPSPRS